MNTISCFIQRCRDDFRLYERTSVLNQRRLCDLLEQSEAARQQALSAPRQALLAELDTWCRAEAEMLLKCEPNTPEFYEQTGRMALLENLLQAWSGEATPPAHLSSPSEPPVFPEQAYPTGTEVRFQIQVQVTDWELLKTRAEENQGSAVSSCDEVLTEGVVNPPKAPLDAGYEILSKTVSAPEGDNQYWLQVTCRIDDIRSLEQEATAFYPRGEKPYSVAEALYIMLIGAPHYRASACMGFHINSWHAL